MNTKPMVRDSSLELYRILVMLLIIAHHSIVNSGLKAVIESAPITLNGLVLLMVGSWGKIGINCFVLITGYFMCTKTISLKKFFKLYFQVVFYGFACNAFLVLIGCVEFDWRMLVDTVFPFVELTWNFVSAYLVFFLLIPFLNVVVNGITRRQHEILLGISLLFLSVLPCVHRYHVAFNYVEWFCVLYFVGAYLRLYPNKFFESRRMMSVMSFLALIAIPFSVWLMAHLQGRLSPVYGTYFFVEDSNKITALLPAVCFFCFFKSLHLPYVPMINRLASTCFAVLLIHANSTQMHR